MMERFSSGARYVLITLVAVMPWFGFKAVNQIDFSFQVTTSIYNLILGKLYCDHYGTMRIEGNQEYSCKLKFKEQSIIDRNPHQVLYFCFMDFIFFTDNIFLSGLYNVEYLIV
jgi:hypothetical protein